jgi:hypothetical protein
LGLAFSIEVDMKMKKLRLGVFALLALFFAAVATAFALDAIAATQSAKDMRISGPYTSGNLSVFFIHGKDEVKGQSYLTLQEALEQKKVVVHETGSVNELKIDNLSGSVVFIQSGDIVKGGRQDRTMQNDLLIPAKAKNVALPAFCVEHGRWAGRQGEANDAFASSNYSISGKDLKLAAKRKQDQNEVWDQVAQNQEKLAQKLAKPVAAIASPSSYELTLENKNVQNASEKLVKDLQSTSAKDKDIVGYAFAINGHLNSADVYASNELFKKLWPKMLNSSAVEAVAEGEKTASKKATADQVRACLKDAEKAPKVQFYVEPDNYNVLTQEDAKTVMFSTTDKAQGVMVHRNYISK